MNLLKKGEIRDKRNRGFFADRTLGKMAGEYSFSLRDNNIRILKFNFILVSKLIHLPDEPAGVFAPPRFILGERKFNG